MNKFYLTAAIPYVNAKPHIGHALEFVQVDVIKRYKKLLGNNVLLLSGGDENALKNVAAAEEVNIPVQEFVDKNTKLFYELSKNLNVEFDVFQKGSDTKHHSSSQVLWKLCDKNGDIYKKEYSGLYCVGCEAFYEKEQLNEKGECFEHPGKKLEKVTEENYFFKLSKYQNGLYELISSDQIKIIPSFRKKEVLNFIKQGLQDISISRSNERAKNWGVPVPNDKTQRMYVWFDALNIYQSGIGFDFDEEMYNKWWPADLHVIGKGILRFHAIYWPAFLLSAKLKLPKSIFVHGYFTVNGQKMSKTLGNVIDPNEIIKKYGVDALRYYLLKEISPTSDGDFSENRLKEVYNADLANGIGNLVARVAKLAEKAQFKIQNVKFSPRFGEAGKVAVQNLKFKDYNEFLKDYRFNEALAFISEKISFADRYINNKQPWKLTGEKLEKVLNYLIFEIIQIAVLLKPFLPETAEKIEEQFKGPEILSQKPLFPRM